MLYHYQLSIFMKGVKSFRIKHIVKNLKLSLYASILYIFTQRGGHIDDILSLANSTFEPSQISVATHTRLALKLQLASLLRQSAIAVELGPVSGYTYCIYININTIHQSFLVFLILKSILTSFVINTFILCCL